MSGSDLLIFGIGSDRSAICANIFFYFIKNKEGMSLANDKYKSWFFTSCLIISVFIRIVLARR